MSQSMGSRCADFSSCGMWAQYLWHTGLVALRHEGSSQTRNRNHVPCVSSRTTAPLGKSQPRHSVLRFLCSQLCCLLNNWDRTYYVLTTSTSSTTVETFRAKKNITLPQEAATVQIKFGGGLTHSQRSLDHPWPPGLSQKEQSSAILRAPESKDSSVQIKDSGAFFKQRI